LLRRAWRMEGREAPKAAHQSGSRSPLPAMKWGLHTWLGGRLQSCSARGGQQGQHKGQHSPASWQEVINTARRCDGDATGIVANVHDGAVSAEAIATMVAGGLRGANWVGQDKAIRTE
jgi:hypothetical protein